VGGDELQHDARRKIRVARLRLPTIAGSCVTRIPQLFRKDLYRDSAIDSDEFCTAGKTQPARKKSSQKSTRPRGAKDVVTFPGAIGRNNACVRADAYRVARGEGDRYASGSVS
jgi:hypothetical protein